MFGERVTLANIERHNGQLNSAGMPTLDNPDDWAVIVSNWPCERKSTSGSETQRGRQTTARTVYQFQGDPYPLVSQRVDENCRLKSDGQTYQITEVLGLNAGSLQGIVEAARESP